AIAKYKPWLRRSAHIERREPMQCDRFVARRFDHGRLRERRLQQRSHMDSRRRHDGLEPASEVALQMRKQACAACCVKLVHPLQVLGEVTVQHETGKRGLRQRATMPVANLPRLAQRVE